MSTSYIFDGSVSINPPLNFREIIKAREVAMGLIRKGIDSKYATTDNVFENYMPLKPEITEAEKEVDEGTLTVKSAAELVPSCRGDGSLSYNMDTLVNVLLDALPGHSWHGEITALHSEHTSAYKLVVHVVEGKSVCHQVTGKSYIKWVDSSEDTSVSDLL